METTFVDHRTGKPISAQQAKDANVYPHIDEAWCHCRRCSNHDAYIDSVVVRMAAAQARLDA